MAQHSEHLDFSGLFKLDVLVHLDIVNYSFYEVGLKKFLAFSSDKELIFYYINPQSERFENNYDWDFLDNPVHCMCFEPSGTWLQILSDEKVLLVPFLPLFIPQNTFDHKWSLSSVTVLPISHIQKPTSVVWWLTKESDNVLIIGSKTGTITFYSLESQTIVGECKVSGEIIELQMCFDDSLDLLALLISRNKSQQWKLVLEHRSYGYNWLHQTRMQNDKDKKEGFMSYIKQLSKDKITLFTQGGSKDDKAQSVEYVLKPVEYLPLFREGSNNWALAAQYVNGRHFLTAFELNEGTLILESPEEDLPSRILRPKIKKDGLYIQGLWSQRLIYLLRKNELEVHSASFSVIQGDGLLGAKREFSELWSAELIGDVRRAHLMSAKEPAGAAGGWREPTFMCDLQLPRFSIEPCLVITNCGAYILNTVCEPCEWLVGVVMRGGAGAEQAAAALGAPVATLLRAAADMLMSRGKVAPAQYLFSLSQSQPDGWVARLGIFGRLHELSMYKYTGSVGGLGDAAITIQLLALLLKMGTNDETKFDNNVKFTTLNTTELAELSSMAASIGLWELVPVFSVHRGHPSILLGAVKARGDVCRGALSCLLRHRCVVPLLLEENAQWLFDFMVDKCNKFDTKILKRICLWLNPLQDQLRPVIRDMKQGITSIYTTRMLYLIATFMHVASAIEARSPCPDIHVELTQNPETWKNQFVPRRTISCGLAHWAVVDEGNARVMMTNTPVNTELIGRVIDVACGRHHTLILTENGLYASGENSFGQLGVGASWAGAAGDAAIAAGALLHVPGGWTAPLAAVAAGHYHSAAVDAGGRLYMWGWGVHGQLGLGSIDDEWRPKLVTRFQGRKVVRVSLGACHSAALLLDGSAWAMGAGVFGQLGGGARHKSSVPARVLLPDPADLLAAGYFHNLALTNKGHLYVWGASPQQVRAAHARRQADPAPASPEPMVDPHLLPRRVDIHNVRGSIVQVMCDPAPASPEPMVDPHLLPRRVDIHNVRGSIVQVMCDPAPASPEPMVDPHLLPRRVDIHNVRGSIVQVMCDPAPASPEPMVDPHLLPRRVDIHNVRGSIVQVMCDPAPASPEPMVDPHLLPRRVDIHNVRGSIVQLSAGWHHSCILDNYGTIYTWGLNFDGQLGSGDRKQVNIPTEVEIRHEGQPEKPDSPKSPQVEDKDFKTKAMVACGGDFTIYVDDDGRIYATGNMHLQINNEKEKGTNRVIMMKTTKRVIKIPASRNNNKFLFQPIDRIDIMFPFDLNDSQRRPIEPRQNPLKSLNDFKNKSWADDVILLLRPWINEENLNGNLNMAAKLCYHNKMYADCLTLLLDNLKSTPQDDRFYLTHTEIVDNDALESDKIKSSRKQDELKIIITNVMSKRIKEISLTILNEEAYPDIDPGVYQALPCCCDEMRYLPNAKMVESITNITEQNLSVQAANIIDKCMSIFPVDTKLWETCFRQSKNFFIDNDLSIPELENVLRKYMETNATTMAAAIMYSNDCAHYGEILSPKFYLNMCSMVMDTWG